MPATDLVFTLDDAHPPNTDTGTTAGTEALGTDDRAEPPGAKPPGTDDRAEPPETDDRAEPPETDDRAEPPGTDGRTEPPGTEPLGSDGRADGATSTPWPFLAAAAALASFTLVLVVLTGGNFALLADGDADAGAGRWDAALKEPESTLIPEGGVSPEPASVQPGTSYLEGPAAVEAFLDAWSESMTATFVVDGMLARSTVDPDVVRYSSAWPAEDDLVHTIQLPYHQAGNADRRLIQIGDAVDLNDRIQGSLSCVRIGGGFRCTPDTDTPAGDTVDTDATAGDPPDAEGYRVRSELEAVARTVVGADATHRLMVVDPATIDALLTTGLAPNAECWEALSITGDSGHRWGRRAQFCFDRVTGAPLFRRILSETRLEVLVVLAVSAEVGPDDLEPR